MRILKTKTADKMRKNVSIGEIIMKAQIRVHGRRKEKRKVNNKKGRKEEEEKKERKRDK